MSVSMNDVRVATRQHLKAITNPIETDWEGDKFTPTNDVEYQSVHLLSGHVEDLVIGYTNEAKSNFILQVTLKYPSQKGTYAIETKAHDIVEHFKRGTTLTKNDITMRVENTPTITNLGVEADREIRAVSINISIYK